jgi:hypothetical protein
MSVILTLDIRFWRPGQSERVISASELIEHYQQLSTDPQLLQGLMIDNFRCGLSIDGEVVSYCTFSYDGEFSPDLLQLYEQHLPDLFECKQVTVSFYEERRAWRFTPDEGEMTWEILDTSGGEAGIKIECKGRCERMQFIDAATDWLAKTITILEIYEKDVERSGGQELAPQIDMARRLLSYSRETLSSLGWKPQPGTKIAG